MRKKTGLMAKISYFVISMVVIALAYLYTDELVEWMLSQMTEFMYQQLSMIGM